MKTITRRKMAVAAIAVGLAIAGFYYFTTTRTDRESASFRVDHGFAQYI